MRNVLIGFFACFCLLSCGTSPQLKLNKQGVQIECDKGWYINDIAVHPESTWITITKEVTLQSTGGNIYFTWVHDSLDLEEMMIISQDTYKENFLFEDAIFTSMYVGKYNQYDALVSDCDIKNKMVHQLGRISVFHANGKTFQVFNHHSVNDTIANNPGIKFIEDHLVIQKDSL